jgi:hypothetical protein
VFGLLYQDWIMDDDDDDDDDDDECGTVGKMISGETEVIEENLTQ